MANQEFYDPHNEKENLHYYSSVEERESLQSVAYQEKQRLNAKRARRSRLIILADIVLLCLLILFFAFARPFLLSTKMIGGVRLHGTLLHQDADTKQIWCFIKIKNLSFVPMDFAGEGERVLSLIVRYGTQEKTGVLAIPSKGELIGVDFGFDWEEGIDYFFVTAQIAKREGTLIKKIQIPVKKYSFLF